MAPPRCPAGRPAGPGSARRAVGQCLRIWGAGTDGAGPAGIRAWEMHTGVWSSLGVARQAFGNSRRSRGRVPAKPSGAGFSPMAAAGWGVVRGPGPGPGPTLECRLRPDADVRACAEGRPVAPLVTKQISPGLLKTPNQTNITIIAKPRTSCFFTAHNDFTRGSFSPTASLASRLFPPPSPRAPDFARKHFRCGLRTGAGRVVFVTQSLRQSAPEGPSPCRQPTQEERLQSAVRFLVFASWLGLGLRRFACKGHREGPSAGSRGPLHPPAASSPAGCWHTHPPVQGAPV